MMPAGMNSSPRSRHLLALKPHQAALKTHRSHQHEGGEGVRKKLRLRDLPAPRSRLHHRPGCLSAPALACKSTGISWRTSPRHCRTPATATVEQTPRAGVRGSLAAGELAGEQTGERQPPEALWEGDAAPRDTPPRISAQTALLQSASNKLPSGVGRLRPAPRPGSRPPSEGPGGRGEAAE